MKALQSVYYKTLEQSKRHIQKSDCIEALSISFFETRPYLEEIIEKIKQKKHYYSVIWYLSNNLKDENIDSPTLQHINPYEDIG